MKGMLKPVIVLASIAAVAALLLAGVNMITKPRIDAYEASVLQSALEEVASGFDIGEGSPVDGVSYVTYRYPLMWEGNVRGYILNLLTTGYGGEMSLVAGFSSDGALLAAKLVSDSETPGVGKKAEAEGYMDKFLGSGTASNPVPASKSDLSAADSAAVSGATITFTGITKALAAGSGYVRSLGGER